jgi:hypothetical protein
VGVPQRRVLPRRTPFDLVNNLRDYLQNRTMRERSTYHEDAGKKSLMTFIETTGELEEGGHRRVDLDEPLPYVTYKAGKPKEQWVTGIRRQARKTTSLNEDRTMAFLKEMGLLDACTEVVVVLNEDAVLAANYEGKITDEQLEALYDESEQFAFYLITEDA